MARSQAAMSAAHREGDERRILNSCLAAYLSHRGQALSMGRTAHRTACPVARDKRPAGACPKVFNQAYQVPRCALCRAEQNSTRSSPACAGYFRSGSPRETRAARQRVRHMSRLSEAYLRSAPVLLSSPKRPPRFLTSIQSLARPQEPSRRGARPGDVPSGRRTAWRWRSADRVSAWYERGRTGGLSSKTMLCRLRLGQRAGCLDDDVALIDPPESRVVTTCRVSRA